MPYLKAESGIQWYFQEKGEGEILLLIHGWSFDSSIWTKQIDFLSRDYKVIAIDLPGHGLSEYKAGVDIASDLLSLIKKTNYEDLTVIGHSFGGVLALKLVMQNPVLFKRLILVNSSPKFLNAGGVRLGLDDKDVLKMQDFLEDKYPEILLVFYRWLFTEKERKMSCFKDAWRLVSDRKQWPQKQALAYFLSMIEQTDLTGSLEEINIPTLIIYSSSDPICSEDAAKFMKERIKNSTLKRFEGGHLPFLMYEEEFFSMFEAKPRTEDLNEYQFTK